MTNYEVRNRLRLLNTDLNCGDYICVSCRTKAYRLDKEQNNREN